MKAGRAVNCQQHLPSSKLSSAASPIACETARFVRSNTRCPTRRTCAKSSHLVGGRGLGMGFSRGSTVVGAGRCAMRPTGAASEGRANKRAASDWKMVCARRWQAASVAAGPPANAAASIVLMSHAIRLPKSRASGPSCASLAQWTELEREGGNESRRRRRRQRQQWRKLLAALLGLLSSA